MKQQELKAKWRKEEGKDTVSEMQMDDKRLEEKENKNGDRRYQVC